MPRIGLFLAATPFDGGAFQYSQSVLRALSDLGDSGFQTIVYYCNPHWKMHVAEHPTVESHYLRLSMADQWLMKLVKLRLLPEAVWRFARSTNHAVKRLSGEGCDAWVFPSQDAWSYFFGVPAVVSIFDLMHRYEKRFPEVSRGFKYFRREWHYRKICDSAECILVDSNVGKRHVVESYAVWPDKVCELPFVPPPEPAGDKAQEVRIPNRYFFYPAQFWAHKNHENLLLATARLAKETPDVRLVLVGSKKNNYAKTLKLIRNLGLSANVQILGYVSEWEKQHLYRNARALVMPTFFGPTNLPPLEAIRLGCPVAVSDIYGMREQLGTAALFFDPNSVQSIQESMHALWTDDELCLRLKQLGHERSTAWTPTQFALRLGAILRNVVREPKSTAKPRQ